MFINRYMEYLDTITYLNIHDKKAILKEENKIKKKAHKKMRKFLNLHIHNTKLISIDLSKK